MSNKTNRLAKNLLAAMSLLGAGGAVVPGVSAAEKAATATAKTDIKAKKETGKEAAVTAVKKNGNVMNLIAPVLSLVGGFGVGATVGKYALGGSGDIKDSDGKVDYDMTALVKISQGATSALVNSLGDGDKKNVINGMYESIAYAVADACVLHKEGVNAGEKPVPLSANANIAILGKTVALASRGVTGYLLNNATEAQVTEPIPASVDWDFGQDRLDKKDSGAGNVNVPGNDLMLSIKAKNPALAGSLVKTGAKVKLEKAAAPDAKCKLTITVGGKIITMENIADKYKDTTVTVAAVQPTA